MPDTGADPSRRPTATDAWRALLPDAVLVAGAVPWLAPAALDHLGDPDGERVDLLAGRPVVVPRLALGHLRLTGADRVPFTHGLLSQDVAGLPEGAASDALLLDHRGQPRAGVTVVRRRDDLFLAVDDGAGAAVRRVLEEHVVFDQVEVQDLDARLVGATLHAADPAALSAAVDAAWDGSGEALAGVIALVDGRPEAGTGPTVEPATAHGRALLRPRRQAGAWAVDVHLLAEDLALAWSAWVRARVRPVGERAWTAGRVAAGHASALGEGRLGLPQETGLEGRISYRKGCYLGQEIMARVEARASLRRGLRRVRLDGPPPGLGLARAWRIEGRDGRPVGALGSAAPAPDGRGWWALAVVRLDADDTAGWQLRVDGEPPRSGPTAIAVSLLAAGGT